jgi:hypothetical protein
MASPTFLVYEQAVPETCGSVREIESWNRTWGIGHSGIEKRRGCHLIQETVIWCIPGLKSRRICR